MSAVETAPRPPRDELVRSAPEAFEVRIGSPHDPPRLLGHFARFNEWTEIDSTFEGHFLERIAPGAFKKTMAENSRMRVLFQHGMDPQIGDKPIGSIDVLREDDAGAYYEVRLLEAPYVREILPGLRAGLYGSSFRFAVQREEFDRNAKASEYNPKGLPERTLKELAVREFGPVTFPAYEGATAGVRSLTDDFLVRKLNLNGSGGTALLERVDAEDLSCLGQMLQLGASYIEEQDEPGDEVNVPRMEAILASISALVPYEAQEDEGAEPEDEMTSDGPRNAVAPPDAAQRAPRDAAEAAIPKKWPPVPPDVWEELWNPGI